MPRDPDPLRPPLTRGASAHLTARTLTPADAAPAVTGHLRNEGTEIWPATRGAGLTVSGSRDAGGHPEPAGRGSRVAAGNKSRTRLQCARSPALARRGSLLCPGWPAAADGAAPDPHSDLGRRLADRFRGSVPRSQGESHPPASRCGRSNERTRPWSVVAVAEKSRKAGAVRVWLAEVAGVGPQVRPPPGVPGCGPHPARAPPPGPWNHLSSHGPVTGDCARPGATEHPASRPLPALRGRYGRRPLTWACCRAGSRLASRSA
jgi:hypothetical protein